MASAGAGDKSAGGFGADFGTVFDVPFDGQGVSQRGSYFTPLLVARTAPSAANPRSLLSVGVHTLILVLLGRSHQLCGDGQSVPAGDSVHRSESLVAADPPIRKAQTSHAIFPDLRFLWRRSRVGGRTRRGCGWISPKLEFPFWPSRDGQDTPIRGSGARSSSSSHDRCSVRSRLGR